LCFNIFGSGYGPDRYNTSIAGIIDMEAVKAVAPLLRKQAEADDRKAATEKTNIAKPAGESAKRSPAIEAYEKQKTPSNGPDPKDYGEFVAGNVKIEITIKEE
jgi:hypothetical protein